MAEFKSTISSQNFDKALQGGLDYAADKSGIWEALENAGGLSDTEKALMLTLFKNAAYTADVSATVTQLEALWSGSEEPDEPIEPDEPVVTTYTVTNTLTNVTNSNTAESVTEGASYTAILTADEGYTIDSVTVTVAGVDVTASVYTSGVISISNVSGNIVITATAVASGGGDGRTPLYNWDLTKSLVDTVSGNTATLSDNGAMQDGTGLTISGENGFCKFPAVWAPNRTIEIDVVSFAREGIKHGRFAIYRNSSSGQDDSGLIYRSTGSWQFYAVVWSGETVVSDSAAFNGKTVRMVIDSDKTTHAYLDGVEFATATLRFTDDYPYMSIGSSNGSSAYTLVVSAIRVYEGV